MISCSNVGINGGDVLTGKETIQRIQNAKLGRFAACGRYTDVQVYFINDAANSIEKQYPADYYSENDVKTCTDNILITPCNSETLECKLKPKTIWSGSLLQGGF